MVISADIFFSSVALFLEFDWKFDNDYRNSTFDLCNINLLNKNICVAQDALE